MNPKWMTRFFDLAALVASWSKDPSTKVGAVIVDPVTNIPLGMGFNGFPRGIHDTEERLNDRNQKYQLVIHAEENAILNAGHDVRGADLYIWPMMPCSSCALRIIQAGIARVFVPPSEYSTASRWLESFERSVVVLNEAGVSVLVFDSATETAYSTQHEFDRLRSAIPEKEPIP